MFNLYGVVNMYFRDLFFWLGFLKSKIYLRDLESNHEGVYFFLFCFLEISAELLVHCEHFTITSMELEANKFKFKWDSLPGNSITFVFNFSGS